MWIGNPMQRCLLAGSLFLLLACAPQNASRSDIDKPGIAWWYTIMFQPESKVTHDIEAGTINKRWRYAHALNLHDLKGRISAGDIKQFQASPLSFSISTDLDGDGVFEEFFVGVYEEGDGNSGRFVIITKNGIPVNYFTEGGSPGFSAVLRSGSEVRWYKCMECGEFESIRWTGQSYVIE